MAETSKLKVKIEKAEAVVTAQKLGYGGDAFIVSRRSTRPALGRHRASWRDG